MEFEKILKKLGFPAAYHAGRAGKENIPHPVRVSRQADIQVAAGHLHADIAAGYKTFQSRNGGYAAAAGTAGEGEILNAALKSDGFDVIMADKLNKAHIGALWEGRVKAQRASQLTQLIFGSFVPIVHNDDGVGDSGASKLDI